MDTKTIIWIVIAVIALAALGVLLWDGRRRQEAHRHAQAEEMRERLRHEDTEVRQRESIAAETEARAQAARAEAEVKAAEAARLQQRAEIHRSEVAATREELQKRHGDADALDAAGSGRSVDQPGRRSQSDR